MRTLTLIDGDSCRLIGGLGVEGRAAAMSWGTLSPKPPWDFSLLDCSSRRKDRPGGPPEKATRLLCCLQAPVGAQVASPQSPILRWSKSLLRSVILRWVFPVSVSLGVYRAGKGNVLGAGGNSELIASAIAADEPPLGEFSQSGANGGGT